MRSLYRIEEITYKNGKTRKDDIYPDRIGSIVHLSLFGAGRPMFLEYVKSNQGHKKEGAIKTSTVVSSHFVDDANMYVVETLNSVYYLKEVIE
jgi:hypothetical protein